MKVRNHKGDIAAIIITVIVPVFSFIIMSSALEYAAASSDIQTAAADTIALEINKAPGNTQSPDINAVSEKQAVKNAIAALESLGFDTDDFEKESAEIRYVSENAPAGNPIWAVIFRDDNEGYAAAFGDDVNDEVRKKIAAAGKTEKCTDENGIPGICAHYSYTRYTLVEINALNGEYVRHGESIVEYGKPLKIEETYWAPTTKEAWETEGQE